MSTVFQTRVAVEHAVSVTQGVAVQHGVAVQPDVSLVSESAPVQDGDWYEWLAFGGPLDPAGTVFAFALSVAATVGLVVLVAAAVRVATGA